MKIEFKELFDVKSLAKWVVAFANSECSKIGCPKEYIGKKHT